LEGQKKKSNSEEQSTILVEGANTRKSSDRKKGRGDLTTILTTGKLKLSGHTSKKFRGERKNTKERKVDHEITGQRSWGKKRGTYQEYEGREAQHLKNYSPLKGRKGGTLGITSSFHHKREDTKPDV